MVFYILFCMHAGGVSSDGPSLLSQTELWFIQKLLSPCTITSAQLTRASIVPRDMLMERMVKETRLKEDGGQRKNHVQACNLCPKQAVTGIHDYV